MAAQVIVLQESFKLFLWMSLCCETGSLLESTVSVLKPCLVKDQATKIPELRFKPTGSLLLKQNMRKKIKEKIAKTQKQNLPYEAHSCDLMLLLQETGQVIG